MTVADLKMLLDRVPDDYTVMEEVGADDEDIPYETICVYDNDKAIYLATLPAGKMGRLPYDGYALGVELRREVVKHR